MMGTPEILFFFFLFVFLPFLGPLPQHMEVPRLGVELELQLPAYATAGIYIHSFFFFFNVLFYHSLSQEPG